MGANISLPPIPDTADAKMKEYLSALTKVLQQKQVDDYNTSETMKDSIAVSHKKGIAHFVNNTEQVPTESNPIEIFGTVLFSNSNNISKISSTQIQLKAGITYRMTAFCRQYGGLYLHYYWKDITTGVKKGTIAVGLSVTYGGADTAQPSAECVVCPQVDSIYSIIATEIGSGATLYGGVSYAIIEELEAYLPIVTEGYSEIDQVVSGATSKLQVQIGAGIIETGSNTNGKWIKFSDGTMICWGGTGSFANTIYNSVYYGSISVTFPVSFYSTPQISTQAIAASAGIVWGGISPVSSTGIVIYKVGVTSGDTGTCSWMAIGRWKA